MPAQTEAVDFFAFDNSYARLPDRFFARLRPTPAAAPRLAQLPNLQSDFTSELAFVAAQVFDFARADKVESSAPCR